MKLQLTKKKVLGAIRYFLLVFGGCMLASAATVFFIQPNNMTMGGTTGIGLIIGHYLSEDYVGFFVLAINAILYILGFFLIGKKFALATLLGTFSYPIAMQIWEFVYDALLGGQVITTDPLLNSFCTVLLMGFGAGIVIRQGSSTGGTDIPCLIFQKYFGLNFSVGVWILDITVILLQGIVTSFDMVLYGMLTVISYSLIIDAVSVLGLKKVQVKIISEKYMEIRDHILRELKSGVTILYGQTGFTKQKCHMLLTIVTKRRLVRLKNAVQKMDPNAFMMISVVSEVRGRGYTSDQIFLQEQGEAGVLEEVSFGDHVPTPTSSAQTPPTDD